MIPRTTRATGRRRRDIVAMGLSAVLIAPALAACGSSPDASSGGSGATITLYNAQHEQTTDALIAAFTKQTGIKVRVDNNDEDVLTAQIEQENGRSPADVILTENSNWLQQLDDAGLLAKVDAATLAEAPRQDSAADGGWLGVSARVSVMIYNSNDLTASQLPTSVMQLADPKWKGKIELAPAETDFWPIVSSVERAHGQAATLAWLKGLAANAGSNANVPDNETLTSDVSQGNAQLGLINHYYYYRLRAEQGAGSVHAEVAYFAPHDPGYVEDISGAAVLRSSKNQAAAQKFLAFLDGEAGQTVLAHSQSFEYPLHPGVAASPGMTPLADLRPDSFTPADLGTGLNAKSLLQQAGLL